MKDDFSNELLNLINKCRTQPTSCSGIISQFKQDFMKQFSYKTDVIDELTSLSGKTAAVGDLKPDEMLNEIASDLLSQLNNSKGTKLYAQDQDYLEVLLGMEFEGIKACRNYLTTESGPKKSFMKILINGDDITEGNHFILDGRMKYIGIAHDIVKDTPATIVVVTDSVIPVREKPFDKGVVAELSKARENPRAFIKHVSGAKDPAPIIEYLQNARRLGQFLTNDMLDRAAQKRLDAYKEDGRNYQYNELVDFLEEYGTRFATVAEYISEGEETARDFVVRMLTGKDSVRALIFDRRFTEVGVAYDKTSNTLVLIFADNFEAKVTKKPLHVISLRRRLHRPDLTKDEDTHIRSDFKSFDILNTGLIKPSTILLFAQKTDFASRNPFYYKAFKLLNTEENNANGVNADEFVNAVKKVIKEYNEDPKSWREIFNVYFEKGKKKKIIDKDILIETVKDMGFKVNDEDIEELIIKMDGDLDEDKFCDIMRIIETRFRRL